MSQQGTVEAFVLAGGKSSRMGEDKGLVHLRGRPMISYVLQTLEDLDLRPRILTKNPRYGQFEVSLTPDVIADKGPLGGLYTAMKETTADFVLILSCDMPLISKNLVESLIMGRKKGQIRLLSDGSQVQPLPGLYPVSLKNRVKDQLKRDQLRMQTLIFKSDVSLVPSSGRSIELRNINTKKDLLEMESTMQTTTVRTFGILTEKLEGKQVQVPYEGDTDSLLRSLKQRYPQLNDMGFSLAVNQHIVHENTLLDGSEEIALLPPYSGG